MARNTTSLLAILVLSLVIRQLPLLDINKTELFPEYHLDVLRPSGVRATLVYDSEHLLHVVHLRLQSLHPHDESHRPFYNCFHSSHYLTACIRSGCITHIACSNLPLGPLPSGSPTTTPTGLFILATRAIAIRFTY